MSGGAGWVGGKVYRVGYICISPCARMDACLFYCLFIIIPVFGYLWLGAVIGICGPGIMM